MTYFRNFYKYLYVICLIKYATQFCNLISFSLNSYICNPLVILLSNVKYFSPTIITTYLRQTNLPYFNVVFCHNRGGGGLRDAIFCGCIVVQVGKLVLTRSDTVLRRMINPSAAILSSSVSTLAICGVNFKIPYQTSLKQTNSTRKFLQENMPWFVNSKIKFWFWLVMHSLA